MKSTIRGLVLVICAASVVVGSDPRSALEIYSPEPYSDPIRNVAENTVEFVKFNNWLNVNYDKTPDERRQALKEHLYSIIDSHVKQIRERDGTLLPVEEDILLPQSFAWASRMGVPGAHDVLAELDPNAAEAVERTAEVPESWTIGVRGDLSTLTSTWGEWTVVFPYHFMVGSLQQYRAANDLMTQTAIISTGFGRHTADDGYSQATIMLAYSSEGAREVFRDFWFRMFRLAPVDVSKDGLHGMTTYHTFDASTHMHRELVFPEVPKGHMVVAYMGLAGTYEHNRAHFGDFVEVLRDSFRDRAMPTEGGSDLSGGES